MGMPGLRWTLRPGMVLFKTEMGLIKPGMDPSRPGMGTFGQGCGVGVETGVGVDRSRPF